MREYIKYMWMRSEEAPVDEEDEEEANAANGCPLAQQGFEVDVASCFAVLCRLGAERGREMGHAYLSARFSGWKRRRVICRLVGSLNNGYRDLRTANFLTQKHA